MNVRNCRKCRRLFNYVVGPVLCNNCKKEMEEVFQTVKKYVRENPGSDIRMVSEACEVDPMQIRQWVKEERQRILSEAETRAQTMVKNAEDKVRQMIDENEVTRQAVEQANQLVNDAQTRSMEIKIDCDQYADDVLGDVEKRLEMLLKKVHDDRVYFNSKQ